MEGRMDERVGGWMGERVGGGVSGLVVIGQL